MSTAERWDLDLSELPPLPEPGEDGTIAPQVIPNDDLANDALRYLGYWYRERERVQQQAAREHLRIDELARRELERIGRRIAWHEGGLRAYLWQLGRRAWRGLYGSVSLRAGRERVEIRDEAAFLAWVAGEPGEMRDQLVRTTVTPSRSGIAAWIKDQGAGELPPGVEVTRGDETLAVVTSV